MSADAGHASSTGETESRTGERGMTFFRESDDDASSAVRSGMIRAGGLLLLLAVAFTACRDPLNVPDPNSIQSEDLEDPAAVPSLVNGSLKNMNEMIGDLTAPFATVTDEIRWIGSRDAWQSLSQGFADDPVNEFSDVVWPSATEARFMADRSISQAEQLQSDLADQTDLVRAYLYGAVVYATIADVYDNFVIPEEPGAAASSVGESNMPDLYDQAIDWLNSAESLATSLGDSDLATRAIAYRARVRHAKAVWSKLNPSGSTPSEPLVSNQQMADDAAAALQRIGMGTDWRWQAQFSANTTGVSFIAGQVNDRGELQFGPEYVSVVAGDETEIDSVVITDPVSGQPDPVFTRKLQTFQQAGAFASQNIVTAREMHLLLAEHNLAQGNTGDFEDYINNVRSIAGKPDFTGQVSNMEILQHTRQVNLLLMNRRLADMYRFDVTSERWLPQSPAASEPGTFFPIAITEIRSNPNVGG